jgi:hypothetical protein
MHPGPLFQQSDHSWPALLAEVRLREFEAHPSFLGLVDDQEVERGLDDFPDGIEADSFSHPGPGEVLEVQSLTSSFAFEVNDWTRTTRKTMRLRSHPSWIPCIHILTTNTMQTAVKAEGSNQSKTERYFR